MRAPSRPPRPLAARPVRSLALAAALAAALTAALAAASPALAQLSAPDSTAPSPASTRADTAAAVATRGPTLDGARAGVSTPRTSDRSQAAAYAPSRGSMGQPVALMIVGGVALAVGLIVGDTGGDLLAFGGAIVGLVGLYQYLR